MECPDLVKREQFGGLARSCELSRSSEKREFSLVDFQDLVKREFHLVDCQDLVKRDR